MNSAGTKILIEFDDLESLLEELDGDLRHGGTFASGKDGLATNDSCELVLVHPVNGNQLSLPSRVVWVGEKNGNAGVAIAIEDFTPRLHGSLLEFARNNANEVGNQATRNAKPVNAPTLHQRLRGLSMAQQLKVARSGEIQERCQLERIYGKNVWEAILRNPKVTVPEVIRIARMAALPTPLLELIAGNGQWLSSPQVRRAVLSNRRLSKDLATKILRMLPRPELRLVPKQRAYSAQIRSIATKMIKAQLGS